MQSIRYGILCAVLISSAHPTLLGEVTVKPTVVINSDPFQFKFAPLPTVVRSNTNKCEWCEAKLKRLESEKIDLTEALNSAQDECDESQADLVKQLSDLQEKYEKLYEAYIALKKEKTADSSVAVSNVTIEDTSSAESKDHWQKGFDHCLDKIASHGWTCHDASEEKTTTTGIEVPVVVSDNVTKPAPTTDVDCQGVKDELVKKSADYDTLLEEKNKLLEDYKNLKAELEKKTEGSTTPSVPATDDSSEQIKTLKLKVSTLDADLRNCLDSKNKYTSFIADLNGSLANALKENEQLGKELKDLKSTPTGLQSENNDEKLSHEQLEIKHASAWIGGRSH